MSPLIPHKESGRNRQIDEERQPLLFHLMAMRDLLVRSAIAVVIGFVVIFYFFCTQLMLFIEAPIIERGITIINTGINGPLYTQLKVCFVAGVVAVSPFIFYQIWLFLKPALYDEEIKLFRSLFFIAVFLFILGVVFCYTCVYGLAINFFVSTAEEISTPMLNISDYVDFLFAFILPFGIVFELPVALYMTTRMGWTKYDGLKKARKYVFLGIFVLAAILTPPDIVSQIMLGIPMYLLFEVGIQVARFTKPKADPYDIDLDQVNADGTDKGPENK